MADNIPHALYLQCITGLPIDARIYYYHDCAGRSISFSERVKLTAKDADDNMACTYLHLSTGDDLGELSSF